MVALSEDARLDRLERHVSLIWGQLHALSTVVVDYHRQGVTRDAELVEFCEQIIAQLDDLRGEL